MKKLQLSLITITILLVLCPFVFSINASSTSVYNAQGSIGSTSILAEDSTDEEALSIYNATSSSPFIPVGNATDDTDEGALSQYVWSWTALYGQQNLSSTNITLPLNDSTISTSITIDFVYDTQEDFGWLDCYYLLNNDANITFPCNASNVSMVMVDESFNDLTFFINDSLSQVFPLTYRYWVNASGTGTPDPGGGGGGGSVTYNPLTRPTIDPFTNETIPGGYPPKNPIASFVLWALEGTKQVMRDLGSTVNTESPAVGFLILIVLVLLSGILFKNSRFIYRALLGDDKKEKQEEEKLKKDKPKWQW